MTFEQRLVWLAAAIDYEGTIVPYTAKGGRKSTTMRFEITIGNTDERLVREVARSFEELGVAHTVKLQVRRTPHKPCWYVTAGGGKGVACVLTSVLPYLISKKERAELVLAMIEHRKAGRKGNQHFSNRVEDDTWLQEQLSVFKQMNKRGVEVQS